MLIELQPETPEQRQQIRKTITEILELSKKIIDKNNGEVPANMPTLEIEMPPFSQGWE